ncbi:MAG: hypothetical protein KF884_02370 [Fimbriimonadaceae bacterium]|nr:hypothetical protein [Fimbriimonadaceae bacterium]QYK58940.1 MAG: hypothetical protein KF884_02370 [Fimbriimonadaceae bacterium]
MSITRREAIIGAAAAGTGLLARKVFGETSPVVQANGGIVSDPVTLSGTIVRTPPPVMASNIEQDGYVFRGGRATGYYTFRLEKNDITKAFLITSPNGPVTMRCRMKTEPGSAVVAVEPESIIEAIEEELPPFGLTLEEAPLTSLEEQALTEIMKMTLVAAFAHPDPNMAAQFLANSVAAFDQIERDPASVAKTIQSPLTNVETPEGAVGGASLSGLIFEPDEDLAKCLYTVFKAVFFLILGLLIGYISKAVRERALQVCQNLMVNVNIKDAVTRLIDVFRATKLKGKQRGDMLRAALLNLVQSAAPAMAQGLVAVFKALPWHQYIVAVGSALAFAAQIAKYLYQFYQFVNTVADIIANCVFDEEAQCQYKA